MVREHLGAILGAVAESLEPLGREPMLLRAGRARRIWPYATSRTSTCRKAYSVSPATESAARAGRTPCARARASAARPSTGMPPPSAATAPTQNDLPDDGRVLQQLLLLGRERVEPGGDDALHGLGQRQVAVDTAPLRRAGARTPRRRAGCRPRASSSVDWTLGREHRALEQRVDEPRRLVVRERRRARVVVAFALAAAPVRAALEELRAARCRRRAAARRSPTRPGGRRSRAGRRRPSADPRTRARAGTRSAIASKNCRQAANASVRLSAAGRASPRGRRGGEGAAHPLASAGSAIASATAIRASPRPLRRSPSPGCRPAPSPSPRAPRSSRRRRTEATAPGASRSARGSASTCLKSSKTSRRLADAGLADERDELRGALAPGARERVRAAARARRHGRRDRRRRAARRRRRSASGRPPPPRPEPAPPCPSRAPAPRRGTRSPARVARYVVSPDEDPVHRRRRLQPRGRVDDVARGHPLALRGSRAERRPAPRPC